MGPPSYMRTVVDRNVVMRRMTVHTYIHAGTRARAHTHTHTHISLTKLRQKVGFPPNSSEYLERLADKVHHTHMRQCCQYSVVLSLCRVLRSRVEALSFSMWCTFLFWGVGLHIRFAADIATRTVHTCTTSYTLNVCHPLQNTQLYMQPSFTTCVTGQQWRH